MKVSLRSDAVSSRRGFTWLELAVALLIIGVLIALLLPATRRARPAARRTQCKNNLKQIALALHNYHEAWGAFPPSYTVDSAGRPLHSWRTLILPYVDQAPLFNQLDLTKPWDDPANLELLKTARIANYACPSANVFPNQTLYLAIVTPQSVFGEHKSCSISEIKDGTANTLMVIEVTADQAVPWYEPRDADQSVLQLFGPKSKEPHEGGRHAVFADGSVRYLSQNIKPETFRALITASGGETIEEF